MMTWLLAVVLLFVTAPVGAATVGGAHDVLHAAGPQAGHWIDLWRLVLGVCTFVFFAIVIAFFIAVWRAPRADAATAPDLSTIGRPEPGAQRSVIAAIAISIVLLLGLIVASVATDRALARLSVENALHIELTGHQWWWEAVYPDAQSSRMFSVANELHVPVGRPVVITLSADDVIHSFWVPNVAGKKDLIPGYSTTIRFRIDTPGTYRGQCAEFCGAQHANMALFIVADAPDRYDAWADLQRQSAPEPANDQAKRGRDVFLERTCPMCHAIQGTIANAHRAPDLTHVAGRATLAAGTIPNTTGYLAGWIVDPQNTKPGTNMPATLLSSDDLQALLAYLETLK